MNLKNITKVPFELPEDILRYLSDSSEMVTFRKNAEIIRPGEVDVPVYFLAAGLARIYYPHTEENEREENILFGEAGNLATSLSNFMLNLPSVFGVSAVTPVKAYRIEASRIRSLYKSNNTFCRWLMELALIQLSHLEVRYTYLNSEDPYKRLVNFMRFKPKSFMRRVPGYQIASYIRVGMNEFFMLKERYERENLNIGYDKEFLDAIGMTGYAPEE